MAWSRTSMEIWSYDLGAQKLTTHGFMDVNRGAMSPAVLSVSGQTMLLRGTYADGSSWLALHPLAPSGGSFQELPLVGRPRSGVLSGERVAWIDEGGLWFMAMDDTSPRLVTASPGEPTRGGEYGLTMNDRGIAWVGAQNSSNPYSWRILYYDFGSETVTCVSDGVSLGQNQNPCLWQDMVVWQGKDSTDAELFAANATGFVDVANGSPYAAAIAALSGRGVILGFDDGTFRPGASVTRQQFAKMIVKALGYSVSASDVCPFTDVAGQVGEDPFYPSKYVAVCAARGITLGATATTFNPTGQITRQQLITMVARATGLTDPPAGYSPDFTAAQFSLEEHYENARRAAYAGLLEGLQGIGSSYDFKAASTRGECAQLLHSSTAP